MERGDEQTIARVECRGVPGLPAGDSTRPNARRSRGGREVGLHAGARPAAGAAPRPATGSSCSMGAVSGGTRSRASGRVKAVAHLQVSGGLSGVRSHRRERSSASAGRAAGSGWCHSRLCRCWVRSRGPPCGRRRGTGGTRGARRPPWPTVACAAGRCSRRRNRASRPGTSPAAIMPLPPAGGSGGRHEDDGADAAEHRQGHHQCAAGTLRAGASSGGAWRTSCPPGIVGGSSFWPRPSVVDKR